jgi:hypothetical protein
MRMCGGRGPSDGRGPHLGRDRERVEHDDRQPAPCAEHPAGERHRLAQDHVGDECLTHVVELGEAILGDADEVLDDGGYPLTRRERFEAPPGRLSFRRRSGLRDDAVDLQPLRAHDVHEVRWDRDQDFVTGRLGGPKDRTSG